MEIAEVELRDRQAAKAADMLNAVPKVTEADAPRFFRILVQAELQNGRRAQARAAAEKLREFAAGDEDRSEAAQMLAVIDHPQSCGSGGRGRSKTAACAFD
jgi:hypothetical protein